MNTRIAPALNRLFVGNLPWTIGRNELKDYFTQFGRVTLCQVIFNRETGMSKGYGFVGFSNESSFSAALTKGKHELEGNVLTVESSLSERPIS